MYFSNSTHLSLLRAVPGVPLFGAERLCPANEAAQDVRRDRLQTGAIKEDRKQTQRVGGAGK